MKEFYNSEWSVIDKKLIIMTAFLSGIIIGFLFAPIKKGICCGNNNGNTRLAETKEKE